MVATPIPEAILAKFLISPATALFAPATTELKKLIAAAFALQTLIL